MRREFARLRGSNAQRSLATIAPIIRGWVGLLPDGGVVRGVPARWTDYLWKLAYKWACWQPPRISPGAGVVDRYFGKFDKFRNDRWVFGDRDTGAYLLKSPGPISCGTSWSKAGHPPMTLPWPATGPQRRLKVKPPLDSYIVRLLSRQDGRCCLCGGNLLTPDQPPQSPQGWERWFLQVIRRAITADYLIHHDTPTAARSQRTHLVHATCHRSGHPLRPAETP